MGPPGYAYGTPLEYVAGISVKGLSLPVTLRYTQGLVIHISALEMRCTTTATGVNSTNYEGMQKGFNTKPADVHGDKSVCTDALWLP